jgi:hypothetical protein
MGRGSDGPQRLKPASFGRASADLFRTPEVVVFVFALLVKLKRSESCRIHFPLGMRKGFPDLVRFSSCPNLFFFQSIL